ncbi:SOS response-associated peptidase [Pseudooceanicola sp. CBS1P-1]|uniref:Abasic site processing protein n=1 Tax=Pseudooceanicola albus TaxID=2692189 RepID=A0A6L7G992_9RHOB|nr:MULTISPECIES: SOS response-associated peptidase [Pseudooceanicola]MBT9386506.1 SOS response-associated peptidase [Pseudooceanicola endophyticus]MXN20539.1 SOS response-associated peptidase [Pseudooceanicola albus]
MCGRFATTLPPDAMARLFGAAPDNDLPPVPDFNVCPTVPVAVVRAGEAGRRLVAMRWGFLPGWYKTPSGGPLLINARAETLAEKPAFRAACRARRCLIPAAGFYEWNRAGAEKLPWFLHRRYGAPLVMAGIWQDWEGEGRRIATCAIVTTQANAVLEPIHHRMPVILEAADWGKWLGEEGHGAARLMKPAPPGVIAAYRVGTAVNYNRAQGPALMAPLDMA